MGLAAAAAEELPLAGVSLRPESGTLDLAVDSILYGGGGLAADPAVPIFAGVSAFRGGVVSLFGGALVAAGGGALMPAGITLFKGIFGGPEELAPESTDVATGFAALAAAVEAPLPLLFPAEVAPCPWDILCCSSSC